MASRCCGVPLGYPYPLSAERVWAIGAGRVAVLAQVGGPDREQLIRLAASALEHVVD
jgi:hypothetical protein